MRKLLLPLAILLAGLGGVGMAVAASGDSTGTNVACATATLPRHVLKVDTTAVYTIAGTSTTACTTATYTIPTSTTTVTDTGTTTGTTSTTSSTSTTSTTPTTTTSTTSSTTTTTPPPPPTGFQSVTYWVGWEGGPSESSVPWSGITQVDLFDLATENGTGLDTANLHAVGSIPAWVQMIHNHGKIAMISIGGSGDQNWSNACNDTNRAGFVANLVNYMVSNGFDGVDIDIEQDNWGAMIAPVAPWDTCVQAISAAAHAATTQAGKVPLVSTDVDPTWMASYVAGFASYPDQFNLMAYGQSLSQIPGDVNQMNTTGKVPLKEMTVGMEVKGGGDGYPEADCAGIDKWSSTAGVGGVMVWFLQADGANTDANGQPYPCFTAAAPYLGG